MKKSNSIYLRHILDSIEKIETYTEDISEAEFFNKSLIQDGAIRQLEIIGEAVKNISKDLREKYNIIPWQDIAGMRDKLIHHYFGVDIGLVWVTIQNDIPFVKTEILKILSEIKD